MSIERPDLEEFRRSPNWPQPRPKLAQPEEPKPRPVSFVRVSLGVLVGLVLLIPLFVFSWRLRPQFPPEGTRIFIGAGFIFQHPEEWKEIQEVPFGPATAPGLSNEAVGVDRINAVAVSTYRLNGFVAEGDQLGGGILTGISEMLQETGSWIVQSGPVETTVDRFPGLGFVVTARGPGDIDVASRLTVVVARSTAYVVSCQHTAEQAFEIETGCDQVMETFQVG